MPESVIEEEAARLATLAHERRRKRQASIFLRSQERARGRRADKIRLALAASILGISREKVRAAYPSPGPGRPPNFPSAIHEAEIAKTLDARPWQGRLRIDPPRRRLCLEDSYIDSDSPRPRKRRRLRPPDSQQHMTMTDTGGHADNPLRTRRKRRRNPQTLVRRGKAAHRRTRVRRALGFFPDPSSSMASGYLPSSCLGPD